jgi:hypothetical protein
MTIAIYIHKLWSRAGASPDAGYLGHVSVRLQPLACRELPFPEILEDADLSVSELSDQQVFFGIAINIGPTRGGVPRAFHADSGPVVRRHTNRSLEVGSAAQTSAAAIHKYREHEWFHRTVLSSGWNVRTEELFASPLVELPLHENPRSIRPGSSNTNLRDRCTTLANDQAQLPSSTAARMQASIAAREYVAKAAG